MAEGSSSLDDNVLPGELAGDLVGELVAEPMGELAGEFHALHRNC